MDINSSTNIVQEFLAMTEEQQKNVELGFHLISKEAESENFYRTTTIPLESHVREWLLNNLVTFLDEQRVENESGTKVFMVGDYNHELKLTDTIARFDVTDTVLLSRLQQLNSGIMNADLEYDNKKTNFQGVKLRINESYVTFFYYRSITKNASKQRRILRKTNAFDFVENDSLLSIGGKVSFFTIDNYLFILDATSFEHAFNYRTHVEEQRDRNIETITSMPFFDTGDSMKEIFSSACKKYIFSRGLANISRDKLEILEQNFDSRCDELKVIRDNAPSSEDALMEYKKKFDVIWELLGFIDVEQKVIIFNDGDNPKLLIHFFGDRIVKSFLSDEMKIALGYQDK